MLRGIAFDRAFVSGMIVTAKHAGRRFPTVGTVVGIVTEALTMWAPLYVDSVVHFYRRHMKEHSTFSQQLSFYVQREF